MFASGLAVDSVVDVGQRIFGQVAKTTSLLCMFAAGMKVTCVLGQ